MHAIAFDLIVFELKKHFIKIHITTLMLKLEKYLSKMIFIGYKEVRMLQKAICEPFFVL